MNTVEKDMMNEKINTEGNKHLWCGISAATVVGNEITHNVYIRVKVKLVNVENYRIVIGHKYFNFCGE